MEITTVGLDIAKRVFQLHGVDAAAKAVLRRKLQRSEVQKVREGGELPPLYVRSSTLEWPLSALSGRGQSEPEWLCRVDSVSPRSARVMVQRGWLRTTTISAFR
jgi:hypothetical protein